MEIIDISNLTKEVCLYQFIFRRFRGIHMGYQISEDAKKRTPKCSCNFECLFNDKWDTCSIEKEISGGLIIKYICTEKFCNYYLSYGSRNICMCPIRVEIFRRYNR
jgi:hypothetical protein